MEKSIDHGKNKVQRFAYYLDIVYFGSALSIAAILLTGVISGWGEWYSRDLIIKQQTEAMIKGELGLSESTSFVTSDMVWDNGRVQQVWGLGVPVLRLALEVPARFISTKSWNTEKNCQRIAFPDRIMFAMSFAIVLIAGGIAFIPGCDRWEPLSRRVLDPDHPERTGVLFLLFLSPSFLMILNSQHFRVYEEVQAYSYLVGIGLLAAAFGFVQNSRCWCFLLGATLSGLAAFVRPTAGVFGVATLTVMLIHAYQIRWSWARMAIGVLLFGIGGILLFVSNWIRFGSGIEFGHNLNLNEAHVMRFASRFEAPFSLEPWVSATRELWSLLFFEEGYRSETLRWRRLDLRAFNLAYLFPLAVVAVWSVFRFWNMVRQWRFSFGKPDILTLWCVVCTMPLFLFYLRFPFMDSRYLLDFAPGFSAGILAFVYLLRGWSVSRFGRMGNWGVIVAVFLWWVFQVVFVAEIGQRPARATAITYDELVERIERSQPSYRSMPPVYDTGMPSEKYVSQFNGSGWDWDSGETRASVLFFVDYPEFLELTVAPAGEGVLSAEEYGIIRAKVGLEFLELESVRPAKEGVVLRFTGPRRRRYQSGIQVGFIAFMTAEELHEGFSRFRLLKVRWKEEGKVAHDEA